MNLNELVVRMVNTTSITYVRQPKMEESVHIPSGAMTKSGHLSQMPFSTSSFFPSKSLSEKLMS